MKEYEDKNGPDKLAILWTSADREVAIPMSNGVPYTGIMQLIYLHG